MLLFRFLVRLVVHKKAVDSMCRTVVTVQRIVVAWLEQKKKDFFVYMSSHGPTRCVFVLETIDLNIAAQYWCGGTDLYNRGS